MWVVSGTHAAVFWGRWSVGLEFLSRWGGGKSFLESQKESNMRKLSEFVKETCLEFTYALIWSHGPLKEADGRSFRQWLDMAGTFLELVVPDPVPLPSYFHCDVLELR